MISDKALKKIMKNLSLVHFIKYEEVEQMCEAQFKLLRDVISGGDLDVVYMMFLGKFTPKDYISKAEMDRINKSKEKKHEARV